jgi:hypothetical protein
MNGPHKQYIQVDIIFNYLFHFGYVAYGVHLCNQICIFERKPDFRSKNIFKCVAQEFAECCEDRSIWPKGSRTAKAIPKGGQREPKGTPKGPKGHPKGAQGLPNESKGAQSRSRGRQRRSKDTQRQPKEAKGKRYISKNSRSTAQADVMLIGSLMVYVYVVYVYVNNDGA